MLKSRPNSPQALNMPPYTLSFIQMLSVDGSLIDLIEWKDPYDDTAPYASVNHLGIARLTLKTADLDADIVTLRLKELNFSLNRSLWSDLQVIDDSFVLKIPDGTIIELVETDTVKSPAAADIHITGFMSVNINCSDYEQSRIFYENLGFDGVPEIEDKGTPETATALGVPSYQVHGSLMELRFGGPVLNLLEWEEPYDNSTPYAQLNHLGIARIALMSTDLDADITRLKAEGIEFFSEPVIPDGPLPFFALFV